MDLTALDIVKTVVVDSPAQAVRRRPALRVERRTRSARACQPTSAQVFAIRAHQHTECPMSGLCQVPRLSGPCMQIQHIAEDQTLPLQHALFWHTWCSNKEDSQILPDQSVIADD